MKTALTDRAIKAMRKAVKAYDVHDAVVPGLSLRVMPSGAKSFVVLTRFPGAKHPTRRALGAYGVLTLEASRAKARQWLDLIARGIDPAAQVEEERRKRERERATTFAAVATDYLDREIYGLDRARPKKRSAAKIEQALTDVLVPLFGARPITALTADEIMRPIELVARLGTDRALVKLNARKRLRRPGRKARPSPEQGRALFTFMEMVCNWAIDHGGYGLDRMSASANSAGSAARCGAIICSMTKSLPRSPWRSSGCRRHIGRSTRCCCIPGFASTRRRGHAGARSRAMSGRSAANV